MSESTLEILPLPEATYEQALEACQGKNTR